MASTCCKGTTYFDFPTRFVIAVMLFTACFVTYMMRVNMSINLIAMVEPSKNNGTVIVPECAIISKNPNVSVVNEIAEKQTQEVPDYGTRYEWDTKLQGVILSSYFWGYIITSIPGGILGEKFGPTRVILISTLIASSLTILGPVTSSWHPIALIVSRFLTGLCGGVIYPCLQCLISRWAPPEEKGKFIGALLGGNFGTVITWPLLGSIIESYGWSWSFFISGAIVVLWCIFWILLVSDTPENHPRISEEEKLYIAKSLGNTIKDTKALPPYKSILLSVPFWAFIILHFGSLWGLFFLMTAGPNYLSTVLGFNIGHTGILAALPYLARMTLGFIFGYIGDFIRKRKLVSTTIVRKGFVLFSHVVPGVLLLIINLTGCDVTWSIVLLTMSLGSNGASTLTNLQNSQDLAPNFAGTVYGMANFFGSTTGFITPLIVGQLTSKHNGLYEWHIILSIGATVYIVCGVIFFIFGSAEMQKWNDVEGEIIVNKNGVPNPAFDNNSEVTVKVGESTENNESTKV